MTRAGFEPRIIYTLRNVCAVLLLRMSSDVGNVDFCGGGGIISTMQDIISMLKGVWYCRRMPSVLCRMLISIEGYHQ